MSERLERVTRVAKLAALTLADGEAEELADDLDRILAYFKELDAIDTTDVPPTAQVQATHAGWRADELVPCLAHEDALAAAPRVEDDGFAVPAFMDVPVIDASAVTLASRVAKGEVTAVALAEAALARIEATDAKLHAFLTVTREVALAQARAVDAKRARGEALGPLAGVPVALKDAICTRGVRTTAGSKILGAYLPPYDATVTSKLRSADAVLVGKTNLDEFAMGSSTENSAFGPSMNPWDVARSPGGSSGGSAVAVAARMASASLGSDTGGSIRQPAAFTGTVGLKPTYGRVSRYGLVAFASSLDQIGPFTTDVASAARMLGVIAGRDAKDATSVDTPVEDYDRACGASVRGLRIGVPDEYFAEGLDPEVEASVRDAIRSLEADGCVVKPVKLPHTRFAVATYYVVATAEASSNLARFDGVRYGTRVEKRDLREMYGATRDAGFGAEVKRRILLGTYVLSAGYYDAYYLKAQKVRTLIRRDFDAAFAEVDVIVSPTAPTPAFMLGEKTADPIAMYLNDVYTLPASLAGLPGISVPCAPAANGLPIGLQLVAPPFCESRLFTMASAWERAWAAEGTDARMITIAELEASHATAWVALFDACGSSCFCRYWHFTGDKNTWLARCAFEPNVNRDEQLALVTTRDEAARGLVAFDGALCVGWMKLTPRAVLSKLRRLPVYKSLDLGPDEGAWSIGCLLVRESHRRSGVARALIDAAPGFVHTWGGNSVEGYPRHADAPLHDEEAWMGPERAFVDAGFSPIAGEEPYRVFRRAV